MDRADLGGIEVSTVSAMLWRRLDTPGHEAARLVADESGLRLAGTAEFVHERTACRLDYSVRCDATGQTVSARIAGWLGRHEVALEFAVDEARRWWNVDGVEYPEVRGCTDLDLSFSPSTNTLPIRRLRLAEGQETLVSSAWLAFPELRLERLDQRYRRTGARSYSYSVVDGTFSAELEVNAAGLVTRYSGLWEAEAGD